MAETLHKAKTQDGKNVFVVQDTGIGISGEAKPNVFKPLFTTKSKGSGVRFAVVKRLTKRLRGTVTFESTTERAQLSLYVCLVKVNKAISFSVHLKFSKFKTEITSSPLWNVR
jgi:signal transduction histidine kinase